MLNACKIWILLSLAMMMLFAGCSDDVLREDPPKEEKPAGNVYIRLQMNLNSNGPAGSRAASRAGEGSTDNKTTPHTKREKAVNSVDILVFDATTDELTDIVFLDETQIGQIMEPNHLVVPIFAKQGQTVKIYAAVNMTAAMRQFFTLGSTGTDFSLSSTGNSYWDVINEFVPGSNGKQETFEANDNGCIPMTGQFKVESVSADDTDKVGSGEITIKGHTTKDDPLSVKADVSRIVAKVHVLAKTDTDGYVTATDSKQNNARIGWITLEDVRYIPNGTNKSSYIFPQEENNTLNDKNMNLEHYLVGGKINAQLWGTDYVFLDGKAVHKANIDSYMGVAEQYNGEKLNITSTTKDPNEPNRYFKGMYCLENYFDIPSNRILFDEYEDVIPMITHVSIAARMTPCEILVESNFETKMTDFVKQYEDNSEEFRLTYGLNENDFNDNDKNLWNNTIKDIVTKGIDEEHGFKKISFDETVEEEKKICYIRHILNWSLMINNVWSSDPSKFDDDRYSDGTFYVYDQKFDGDTYTGSRYLYLTVGAVSSASDENIHIKARSVPHIGGWGYYYTYIDNDGSTQNGKTPYTASQVTRNTYYIITVENFGYPGGSITNPEYIKVNTRPVGWDYVGKGNINLH